MKNKKGNIGIGIIIIVTLIIGITSGFFPATLFGTPTHPSYVYSSTVSSCSCVETSRFDKSLGDYKKKVNVFYAQTYKHEKLIEDDNKFIWDIGFRCSKESQGNSKDGKGLPAQERCDGTFDCNYGFTKNDWELKGNKCYVVVKETPQPITQIKECNNGQLKCIGKNFNECKNEKWVDSGELAGKCGVEDIPLIINKTYETIIECSDNVGCIDSCGEQTPTCTNNKCYCDNNLYVTKFKKESIVDKINNFIQSIFEALFGWI